MPQFANSREKAILPRFFVSIRMTLLSGRARRRSLASSGRGKFRPSTEDFADGPGLRDATAGSVRRIAIEDFRERTEAVGRDVPAKRIENTERGRAVLVHAKVRKRKRTEKPTPHRALMIRSVSRASIATVVTLVVGFTQRQAAQAVRSEEMFGANIHDGFLLLGRERTDG